MLLTQTLVQLQRVSNQELANREQIIDNHLLMSQEKEVEARKEIEVLNKEKDRLDEETKKKIEELKRK